MGTRAAFWLGDPRDLNNRLWLGCIAWDGYPGGIEGIENIKTEDEFLSLIKELSNRKDFAAPEGGWPFPWADDIFLTDYTYAFYAGKLHASCYHQGLMPFDQFIEWHKNDDGDQPDDPTCSNVPAPTAYNPSQPDSILIFSRGRS